MGAWGPLAFDNDEANDWAFDLDTARDLTLVEETFAVVEQSVGRLLEQPEASEALAACEVLARLRGHPGYQNAYTAKVDEWVESHRIDPPAGLIARGNAVIDRVLGDDSELRELWEESGPDEWLAAVEDLRARMTR
jgi:Domain of unknown function (DUF4259)